jgi:uncharacterized protein YndB with AHSA1/START domain
MTTGRLIIAAALLAAAQPAGAGITNLTPHTFISSHMLQFEGLTTDIAFRHFVALNRWWDPAHSYSGRASAIRFRPRAGTCWCERFAGGGSVEHMRVQLVQPGKRLVMSGGLGPLMFQGVAGTMDVTFAQTYGGRTLVSIDYRVAGFAYGNADKNAHLVDKVLAEQAQRYAAYVRSRSSVTKAKAGPSPTAG